MNEVEKALKNSQYEYKSAQILPGMQEAASGWASANYLFNNLTVFKVRLFLYMTSDQMLFLALVY